MASDDQDKKPGDEDQANQEVFQQERDPDEAVLAEQAIHHYAEWVLTQVGPMLETAMQSVADWFISQPDSKLFDNQALLEAEGRVFVEQMLKVFGGANSPIGKALFPELDGRADFAARDGSAYYCMVEMRSAARDCCWILRDNLQSILANNWDQLRDLAYEGNREFVPVLHKLGLPDINLDQSQLAGKFTKEAENFRNTIPQQKEEAEKDVKDGEEAKQEGDSPEKPKSEEQQTQQADEVLKDQDKKQAIG